MFEKLLFRYVPNLYRRLFQFRIKFLQTILSHRRCISRVRFGMANLRVNSDTCQLVLSGMNTIMPPLKKRWGRTFASLARLSKHHLQGQGWHPCGVLRFVRKYGEITSNFILTFNNLVLRIKNCVPCLLNYHLFSNRIKLDLIANHLTLLNFEDRIEVIRSFHVKGRFGRLQEMIHFKVCITDQFTILTINKNYFLALIWYQEWMVLILNKKSYQNLNWHKTLKN